MSKNYASNNVPFPITADSLARRMVGIWLEDMEDPLADIMSEAADYDWGGIPDKDRERVEKEALEIIRQFVDKGS